MVNLKGKKTVLVFRCARARVRARIHTKYERGNGSFSQAFFLFHVKQHMSGGNDGMMPPLPDSAGVTAATSLQPRTLRREGRIPHHRRTGDKVLGPVRL